MKNLDPRHIPSLIDFYVAYLKQRKLYFEQVQKKILKGKLNVNCFPLRHLQQDKSSGGGEVEKKPVFLPRGLFNDAIIKCLKYSKLARVINVPRKDKKPILNIAYLIKKYQETLFEDEMQEFYREPRNYRLFDDPKPGLRNKKYLTLEQRINWLAKEKPELIPVENANQLLDKEDRLLRNNYNTICENESVIRYCEIQDIILFMIARSYFPNEIVEKSDIWKLKNIKGVFDLPVSFNVMISTLAIGAENVKIKDYGKVFSVINDSKLKSLAKSLDQIKSGRKDTRYEDYRRENEEYERCRVDIVRLCQAFEKMVVSRFDDIDKRKGEYYNFNDLVTEFRIKTGNLTKDDALFLIGTRNMFMHNEYKPECIKKINTTFCYAKSIYDEFKEKMECNMI